tara:strand:- start:7325 stop:7489 length:165 start_codon:yes stop_codon:yes gene_type:complete
MNTFSPTDGSSADDSSGNVVAWRRWCNAVTAFARVLLLLLLLLLRLRRELALWP